MPFRWGIVMSATITSGLQRLGGLDHRAAILYHTDEVEFGNEQAFQSLRNDPVIIDQQDAHSAHGRASRTGTHAMTVVPLTGSAADIELSVQRANPLAHARVPEARAMILRSRAQIRCHCR